MDTAPEHARLPPSSAYRWRRCTASVGFIERNAHLLPKKSSPFADRGTRAHALAKAIFEHTLGQVADDAEMQSCVEGYVKWVLHHSGNVTPTIERRVPLFYLPTERGTIDAFALTAEYLFVGDYKDGVGVSVNAVENDQLASYAESLVRELEMIEDFRDDFPILLGIYQPRDRNNPEPERLWRLTRKELREFCEKIEQAARTILDNGPVEFVADPDKQCRFCPASGICKAYASHGFIALSDESVDVALAEDGRIELPSPDSLTREQRIKIIAMRSGVEKWLEAVENQEVTELMAGAAPMGFKLVEGKSNRRWADAAAVDKLLSNYLKVYQRRPPGDLVSPAAVEKLLKGIQTSARFNNALQKLITKPEGKPTLVPESDKRPALEFNPTQGLNNLDSDDII